MLISDYNLNIPFCGQTFHKMQDVKANVLLPKKQSKFLYCDVIKSLKNQKTKLVKTSNYRFIIKSSLSSTLTKLKAQRLRLNQNLHFNATHRNKKYNIFDNLNPYCWNSYTQKSVPMLKLTLISFTIKDLADSIRILDNYFSNLSNFFIKSCYNNKSINFNLQANSYLATVRYRFAELFLLSEAQSKGVKKPSKGFKKPTGYAQQRVTHCTYIHKSDILQLAQQIARTSVLTSYQKIPQRTKLFTLTRSAFIFKKTREQFGLTKKSYFTSIIIKSKTQQQLLLQFITLLKLPIEIKIQSNY
jgi:ribosomal protein S10